MGSIYVSDTIRGDSIEKFFKEWKHYLLILKRFSNHFISYSVTLRSFRCKRYILNIKEVLSALITSKQKQ